MLIAQEQGLRLLVIGDDDEQGQLYKRYLVELSHQITAVDSLEQAAAAFKPSTYDCIVADLSLPDAWPAQSSRWYGELAHQRVPIVVVSGNSWDVHYTRQNHPELPYVFAKGHLDPQSLGLFVSAAVRTRAMFDREQKQESLELVRPAKVSAHFA